ncbi:MAG: hypothetical protein C4298_01480 [Thermus sp.]|uniref:phosphate-starvation-inducible PsiE family protein n=1 Tax=Thermus sp. TaxID=275 RepID=UPI0033179405
MTQTQLIRLFRLGLQLVFNLVILALLIGLFVGSVRTFLDLGLTLTEPTVRLGLKNLITNTLSLVIILELARAFVEYFEFDRVRLEVLLEVGVALALRELLLALFAEKLSGLEVFLWSLGILALVLGRSLAIRFSPGRKE